MATTETEKQRPRQAGPWYQRVFWLVAIWFLSVIALGIVASAMRWMMHMAGMTSH